MIEQSTIDKIFAVANIVEVIGDFITLKRNGINYKACCPFHNEKTPSFVVSPAKGFYKCFGCSKGGNVVSFVMDHENINYVDALKYLGRKYHIEVEERDQTPEDIERSNVRESMLTVNAFAYEYFKTQITNDDEGRAVGLSYFRERGFTDITIDKFGLGYCPSKGDSFSLKAISSGYKEEFLVATGLTIVKEQGGYYDRFCGRVIFPIHSLSGRVIAFGGRTLRSDKKVAKYLNSPESEVYHKGNTLYGIYQAKKAITEKNFCILVEGYTDVISMHQAGIENVVASSGTSLTNEQIRLISRFTKNITVLYDSDPAGVKASMRGVDMILAEGLNVRVVMLDQGEDPDSFARNHSVEQITDYIYKNEVDFLTFKTNLLLNEVKDDPIGRASVVTEIINSISVIPDEIVRYQFISECSSLLNVDKELISREVAKRVMTALHGTFGKEIYRNEQKKQNLYKKQTEYRSGGVSSVQVKDVVGNSKQQSLNTYEEEFLEYLLIHGAENFYITQRDSAGQIIDPLEFNVGNTIIDDFESDDISFLNSAYKELFEAYVKELARVQELNGDNIVEIAAFMQSLNADVSQIVVNLMIKTELYSLSTIWAKYDISISEYQVRLEEAIPKALDCYKGELAQVIYKDDMISQLDDMSEDDSLEMLKKIAEYNKLINTVCRKHERIK